MNKVKIIFRQMRDKKRVYKPKFKVGDVIINDVYKVVRRVAKVDILMDGLSAWYELEDLENPFRTHKAMKDRLASKECRKIDSFYELIDPKTAEVIYGKK